MAQFIVRNLEDEIHDQLRKLARSQGLSMEEMVRVILRRAVLKPVKPRCRLGSRLASRFATLGLKQDIPEIRGNEVDPPSFDR